MTISGMPKITTTEDLIFELLLADGNERYGLELVEQSGGRLARGSVYVILSRMEEKGFVESKLEDADPRRAGMRRRRYKVTGFGRRVYDAWQLAHARIAEVYG